MSQEPIPVRSGTNEKNLSNTRNWRFEEMNDRYDVQDNLSTEAGCRTELYDVVLPGLSVSPRRDVYLEGSSNGRVLSIDSPKNGRKVSADI